MEGEKQLLEAQLLYSVLANPKWVSDLIELEEKDFDFYQNTFKAIKKLTEEKKEVDYGAVFALTKEAKEVAFCVLSNENYGFSIIPTKEVFDQRLSLLKELSIKLQIEKSYVNELDLAVLEEKIKNLQTKGKSRWLTGEDLKNLAYEILKEKKEKDLIYHLALLDKFTGGIDKGQYIIVAGRPSVGKSAFLQFVGLKNAEKGKKVLFVSVEMSEEMIVKRILHTYQPETIPQTFNILVASSTTVIEKEIESKARDFDLILIDYIQLLKPAKKYVKDLYERVTEVSSDLKKIASRFSIPLICASQFSRKAEGRQPTMADLKESGALEQDADVIISLWRDKQDDELNLNKDITMVRIDLLKNRQGQTFNNSDTHIFKVAFNKKLFVFNDLENEIPANNNQ